MRHAPAAPASLIRRSFSSVMPPSANTGACARSSTARRKGNPRAVDAGLHEGANTGLATRTSAPRTSASATSSASWTFVPTHANPSGRPCARNSGSGRCTAAHVEAARRLHVRVRDEGDATARADGGHLRCEKFVGGIVEVLLAQDDRVDGARLREERRLLRQRESAAEAVGDEHAPKRRGRRRGLIGEHSRSSPARDRRRAARRAPAPRRGRRRSRTGRRPQSIRPHARRRPWTRRRISSWRRCP